MQEFALSKYFRQNEGMQRRRESEEEQAVEKECRTSGGQTDMTDFVVYRIEGKEK